MIHLQFVICKPTVSCGQDQRDKKSSLDIPQAHRRQVVKLSYRNTMLVLDNRCMYLLAGKQLCKHCFQNLLPISGDAGSSWYSSFSSCYFGLQLIQQRCFLFLTYSCRWLKLVISFEWAMSFRLYWLRDANRDQISLGSENPALLVLPQLILLHIKTKQYWNLEHLGSC